MTSWSRIVDDLGVLRSSTTAEHEKKRLPQGILVSEDTCLEQGISSLNDQRGPAAEPQEQGEQLPHLLRHSR